MVRRQILCYLAALLVLAGPVSAASVTPINEGDFSGGATLIDFNTGSGIYPSGLNISGATFSWSQFVNGALLGGRAISFDSPINRFGVREAYPWGDDPIVGIEFFANADLTGSIASAVSTPGDPVNPAYHAFESDTLFRGVALLYDQFPGSTFIDDVRFENFDGGAVVPVPAAAWMGLALLAGLGLVQVRRSRTR